MSNGGVVQNKQLKYFDVESATEIEYLNAVKRGEGTNIVVAEADDDIVGIADRDSASGSTARIPVAVCLPDSFLVGRAGAAIVILSDEPTPLKVDANGDLIPRGNSGTIVGYARHAASSGDRVEFDPIVSE